ncbi:hypothetical protein WR25_17621 [Diploscapter pachys]|uniref:LysR substrate-binding domain-containing protein n=1 Tax=Diploscapter pachys TaxID=2018661 RepID=A0A2A2KDQ9_9BILA|nr:hypothetical protein WR25_17621 [Diploscapter pachys]
MSRAPSPVTTGEYGERFILPLIPLFAARYPALSLSYDTDSSLSDLIAERLDLVVRLGALPDSNLRSRQLAEYDIVVVAAPAFLARHAIERPEALTETPWIANSNLQGPTAWTLHSAQAGSASVVGRVAYQSNASHAIRAMACAGLGVAVLPAWLGAAHGSRPMPRRMTPVTVCTACSNAMSDSGSPSLSRVTWKPKSA